MRPSARSQVAALLRDSGGVIARRDHPELVEGLAWLVRRKKLQPVLPGIYAPTGCATDPHIRIKAAMLWDPGAVLVGSAAALVSFWPTVSVDRIVIAVRRQHRSQPAGFLLQRRAIPSELVVHQRGLRFTAPAMTALDLCDTVGGDGIDTTLRTRTATLQQLHEAMALTTGRAGNTHRRMLLLDSRDEPWSAAERQAHRLLRAARVTGWKANAATWLNGRLYYLDVAFEAIKLALEIDGRLHEDNPMVFENDRWRQNELVQDGWRVLRFTWSMLTDYPDEVVRAVRAALGEPAAVLRAAGSLSQPRERRRRQG